MVSDGEFSNRQKVGLRVRALREEARLTQVDLALATGLHVSYLRNVEAGRYNLGIDSITRIADGLGVSLSDFFADDVFSAVGGSAGAAVYPGNIAADDVSVHEMLAMPTDERTVLAALADDPARNVGDIARATGYSRSSVHRVLRRLIDAGRVRRVGSRKAGSWEVVGGGRGGRP